MFTFPTEPFIIAEISANHNGDFETAVKLLREAKHVGADAVKFQLYTADEMTIDFQHDDFTIKKGPWKGRTLYSLYSDGATPREWFPFLFRLATDMDIIPFASVFSKSGVDYLETLDCSLYKIASFEISDIPLIEHTAATGKPLIISTGVATEEDMNEVYRFGAKLLECVSDYPATSIQLPDFHEEGLDGLSDHTLSTLVPALAVARGATIIEKHLTLSRANGGMDASFSLEPDEFRRMVLSVREAWNTIHGPAPKKSPYTSLRRSLYVVEDIEKGERFTERNIRSIRPGHGMEPKYLKEMLTKRATVNYKRGQPL